MSDIIYLSKEGYENLKSELNRLKNKERPKIINQISEARDKGDLSENAEYDAAKEAQGLLEARIAKLESDVANSRILNEGNSELNSVRLLTKVTIENLENNVQMQYAIVSHAEADLSKKKISVDSPIGKGLLGKKIEDIVSVDVPSGIIKFKIIKIDKF
tara:strand:- start:49 stop:525 length:477 start_codon:yes stop_codon:yes gene_type:complete